jgi:hypothetical protein
VTSLKNPPFSAEIASANVFENLHQSKAAAVVGKRRNSGDALGFVFAESVYELPEG